MTPKDKAWVILCELNNAFVSKDDWQNSTEYAKKELKRKAIYLVSEIIDSMPLLPVTKPVGSHSENIDNSNRYWADVKQALENL
jgi:hypothetical protein